MIDYRMRFGARVADAWAALKPAKPGLHVQAAADGGAVELLIYDAIGADPWGDGVAPKDVVAALADAGDKPVVVRVNSPGGSVFDGFAILNALRDHKAGVTVRVDGMAASAASVIAMAGPCEMGATSQMMIHNAWAFAVGNKADMRKMADTMDRVDGQMAALYAEKSGKPVADIHAAMDAETWYTGQEAVDAGLADSVCKPAKRAKAEAALPRTDPALLAKMQAAAAPDATQTAIGAILEAQDSLGDAIAALTGAPDDSETENDATMASAERERARRVRLARLKIALSE